MKKILYSCLANEDEPCGDWDNFYWSESKGCFTKDEAMVSSFATEAQAHACAIKNGIQVKYSVIEGGDNGR